MKQSLDEISNHANALLDDIRDEVVGYSVNEICVAVAFLLLELSESECVQEANADNAVLGSRITLSNMLELVKDVANGATKGLLH
jgi:hypothetical protein